MRRALLAGLTGLAAPASSACTAVSARGIEVSPPPEAPRAVDLERRGEGFPIYRIPALAITNAGTLIAAYDGRPSMADLPSHISLVVRRSTDTGRTWLDRQVVRDGPAPQGYGDPSLLVDRGTGRVFLFHAASVFQGFGGSSTGRRDDDPDILHTDVSYSDDDGGTWHHRRLTSTIKDSAWGGLFASSGEGIQLRQGPHAGRLIQQYAVRYRGGTYAASLYSDDHGEIWRMGALVGPGLDENKTVELSDGTVMLNSRAKPFRQVAISTDGGVTYTGLRADSLLVDPANNGSIVRVNPDAPPGSPEGRQLLFSNTASARERANLTVRLSCDDGRTWPVARTVEPGPAAYSTLTMLPGGQVGLLYERGDYEAITFARFDLRWLGACASTQPDFAISR